MHTLFCWIIHGETKIDLVVLMIMREKISSLNTRSKEILSPDESLCSVKFREFLSAFTKPKRWCILCIDWRVNQRILRFRVNICVNSLRLAPNTLEHLPTVDWLSNVIHDSVAVSIKILLWNLLEMRDSRPKSISTDLTVWERVELKLSEARHRVQLF